MPSLANYLLANNLGAVQLADHDAPDTLLEVPMLRGPRRMSVDKQWPMGLHINFVGRRKYGLAWEDWVNRVTTWQFVLHATAQTSPSTGGISPPRGGCSYVGMPAQKSGQGNAGVRPLGVGKCLPSNK